MASTVDAGVIVIARPRKNISHMPTQICKESMLFSLGTDTSTRNCISTCVPLQQLIFWNQGNIFSAWRVSMPFFAQCSPITFLFSSQRRSGSIGVVIPWSYMMLHLSSRSKIGF